MTRTHVEHGYAAALAYLYGLTDWERRPMDRSTRERLLLERPAALLARLGHPERRYHSVLVAGTKGKGSTAAMLASILEAAGLRTGFYSQPHLHTYRERIRVNGTLIAPEEVAAGVERLRTHAAAIERERPDLGACTTYEMGTALALDHFAQAGIDVAVLEVGLGGRLDATNVVDAGLAVITSISYDHTAILGDTLAEIAGEKAGIVKRGKPLLTAPQRPEALAVLAAAAAGAGAPLAAAGRAWTWHGTHGALSVVAPAACPGVWRTAWRHEALSVPLFGAHQLENAATAVAAAHALCDAIGACSRLTHEAVAAGVAATRWPARFEVVRARSPGGGAEETESGAAIVIDGAHNGDSAQKLAAALRTHLHWERLWLVLGAGVDKDLSAIVAPLAPLAAGAWAVAARHPRSRPATDVAETLAATGLPAHIAATTSDAIQAALSAAGPQDAICVTGSLFIAAEAREALSLPGAERPDPVIA